MIWRCMTWEGVDNLHLIEGNMDKHMYHEILEMELMNTNILYTFMIEEKRMLFSNMTTIPNILLSMLQSGCWHKSFNSFGIRLNHLT